MIIINNINAFRCEPNVATMGFFDGVHLGHAYLIRQMIEKAHSEHKKSAIITFDKHPRVVLQQDFQPKLLNSYDERISLLSKFGCDYCVIIPFTTQLSKLSANDFLKEVLKEKINVSSFVVGHDHRFGRYREESFGQYCAYGEQIGMKIERCAPFETTGLVVSSSLIREQLRKGDMDKANALLGHPFVLEGTVVEGNRIGRRISFPTANLQLDEPMKITPCNGVYAARVRVDGQEYDGMLNIGTRPTVAEKSNDITIECNIFDFDKDIYGKRLSVIPVKFIREERKFDSLQLLAEQLEQDRKGIVDVGRQ